MARPWNQDFKFSDRERWVCIYPVYINSKRTVAEGRRIPKDKSIENPTYSEMRDVLANAGLTIGVENKVHPREQDPRDGRFRGRIRIQLREDDGTLKNENFPNRRSIMLHLGETIPKLKSRQQGGGGSTTSQPQSSGGQKKQKNKKGKR
ncbi:signal recognition particle 19 kDa protein-like [Lineus longissimus]|uniref:signal recognition particle 19 kDa protein-like n=1 Tax=Lineus longissimus TaxID=88925 RepID=UPI002B4DD10D